MAAFHFIRRPRRFLFWSVLIGAYVYWVLRPMLFSASANSQLSSRRWKLPKWLRFWPFHTKKSFNQLDIDDLDWDDLDLEGFDFLDADDGDLEDGNNEDLNELFDLEELLKDNDDFAMNLDTMDSNVDKKEHKVVEEKKSQVPPPTPAPPPEPAKPVGPPVTFVTGASSLDFGDALKTIYSIRQLEINEKQTKTTVYLWDFGLSAEQLKQVDKWKLVTVMRFTTQEVPTLGRQTWKPLAISKMATLTQRILWLDPGTTVECALTEFYRVLDNQGVFVLENTKLNFDSAVSSAVKQVLEYPTTPSPAVLPVCAAGAVGLDVRPTEFPGIVELLESWRKCARLNTCMPTPSQPIRRKDANVLSPDDASLSVLVHKKQLKLHPVSGSCLFVPSLLSAQQGALSIAATSSTSSVDFVSMMLALQQEQQ